MKLNVMKKTILALLLITSITKLNAQQNFEGEIIYSIKMDEGNSTLHMYYGHNKVKAILDQTSLIPGKGPNNTLTIYDFSKGVRYNLNIKNSSYTIDSLPKNNQQDQSFLVESKDSVKQIMGYNCRKYVNPVAKTAEKNLFEMELNTWIPDSLFYIIPAEYRNTKDFMLNERGNIINLETSMSFTFPELSVAMGDSVIKVKPDTKSNKTSLYVKADTIMPASLPDNIFDIPKSYAIANSAVTKENVTVEKVTVTESVDEPPTPPPPPPAKRKAKKTTAIKTKPHNP